MPVANTNWGSPPLGISHQGLFFTKYKLALALQSMSLRVGLIIFAGKTKVYILLEKGNQRNSSRRGRVPVCRVIKKQKVAFNRFVVPLFDFS